MESKKILTPNVFVSLGKILVHILNSSADSGEFSEEHGTIHIHEFRNFQVVQDSYHSIKSK